MAALGCQSPKVLLFYVLTFGTFACLAQPKGFKVITNPTDFKAQFAEAGKKINSVQSNFTQEKNLSLLEEKITSEGKFWYKKDDKVRLEYQTPFRYLMILNGDQMIVRDEQKESRISTHSNKLFQQINRIVMGCVNGSILDSKDFTSQIYQNDKTYLLSMAPNSKTLKEFFQTIQVSVDKKDWSVLGITMIEPGGDNTVIKFTDRVLNGNLNDSIFTP
jgi:outer membrane lipoprotein-sorting protein